MQVPLPRVRARESDTQGAKDASVVSHIAEKLNYLPVEKPSRDKVSGGFHLCTSIYPRYRLSSIVAMIWG